MQTSLFHLKYVPASFLWPMQILDSSLNIIFIQLSARNESLSLAQFNLIFFRLCISAGFCWIFSGKSHFIQPISCCIMTHVDSFLICFVVYFFILFSKHFLSVCHPNALISYLVYQCFPFLTTPISFIFAPNFRHSWQEKNVFCNISYDLLFRMSFISLSMVSTVLLLESCFLSNEYAQTLGKVCKNCRPICMSMLWLNNYIVSSIPI